ncbi:MAG: cytochrome c oxidase, cbb3-type, subunit I/cytochrome c oxidase, cbb3-type, subunit [Verrucomicrobia bacterium]|jgi:cytochrome c oxidase cbb3-type subunit I/II|nr:cytochrome c oxidase, cbb3-type, subunit I/cytochrome c oxidase, cbb3-type, subunit [Verrucomicrobiota bacterium]
MNLETFKYDNRIVRAFAIATIIWGIVGMSAGLLAAVQLFWPEANLNLQFVSFGRLRPLHTNAVIFAFVGNGMFMGIYYSLQRLCKARMFNDKLSWINFWGWNAIIVAAAVTLPLGLTTSKEYAELEWPIDIAIAIVWVVFTVNLMGTILRRREKHMYVAIWFFIATALTVAMLHIVNSLAVPASAFKSYPIYAGVQDALVQWWYGHNAVAFFLTTPYLGLMYYFLPKAAGRPVFSYRLSIIHFWALIFIYIWAGPHHLLFTALPDWAQSLGMVFSIMLIAPSWGGMLNGLLTLRGAWDKVREEPMLKFMVVALTAYGMATLEGPLLSIKSVNSLSHYTDWTVAHVHTGALGWNGFLTFSMLYWLFPRLYNTPLWSKKLANWHFWISLTGMMFYVIPMYWSGITQGLMWKQFTPEGFLKYANFLETVIQLIPMFVLRAVGGLLYILGTFLMAYNLWKTAKSGVFVPEVEAQAAPRNSGHDLHAEQDPWKHRWLEAKPITLTVLSLVAVAIGGLVEIVPMYLIKENVPTLSSVKPYTPLEVLGRDIYIREGCVGCHSQMIRPFRSETERYGEYSKAGEFVYDHPFLWGSKRTGPDLHRVGAKYPDAWHYNHMDDPRLTSPGSIMPRYSWLLEQKMDKKSLPARIAALRKVGVPYPAGYENSEALKDLEKQAETIVTNLKVGSVEAQPDKEIIAMIAYLQRLGTDIKAQAVAAPVNTSN